MHWLVVGRDQQGHRRQITFEVDTEAEARARVQSEGWQEVEFSGPDHTGLTADDLGDTLSPAIQDAASRAAAEPSPLRRFLIAAPAAYISIWKIVLGVGLAIFANVLFGGPTLLSGVLGVLLLLPALVTGLGGRPAGWYLDYRWAVAKGDWPTALDRAVKLDGVMQDNMGKCLLARAMAGSGALDAARELMTDVEVNEGFSRTNYLVQSALVLTEAGDYEGALQTQLALADELEDKATGAQGVAMHYALYMQDGPSARPYLDRAQAARGRGRQVDLLLDVTEVFVRAEEGDCDALLPFIEKLIPAAESEGESSPELWGLEAILRCYACLASAQTDPQRAAEHFSVAAQAIAVTGPEHLERRCLEALGVDVPS